ncbi:MAG: hypothetical protein FRX48_01848 [Lasallia pustulata]|uniref:Uncharacterized protein n=1 Tax=Lasallia pustulata TaxID=136370 RepID=A0A5M8Q2D0_9LECA|nr:MAG: hypothetical protein FRX48_01848 [Lasallia pustulata]
MASQTPQHERFGLLQLYPAPSAKAKTVTAPKARSLNAQFDIFALHGLNGDREETWTYTPDAAHEDKAKDAGTNKFRGKLGGKDSKTDMGGDRNPLWLRDYLKDDFPNARIYSVGYNSKVAFSFGTGRLDSFARELLVNIQRTRETENEKQRPILFVCHSMGGLVVKKALLVAHVDQVHYKNILDSTTAVFFLGTPHGGSDSTALAKPLVDIARIVFPRVLGTFRKDLVASLERNGPELLELSGQFRSIVDKENIHVFSFVEQDRHPLLSSRVVDEASATIGTATEEIIPINGHHTQITRYVKDSNNYAIVLLKLRQHVDSPEFATVKHFIPRITQSPPTFDESSPTLPGINLAFIDQQMGFSSRLRSHSTTSLTSSWSNPSEEPTDQFRDRSDSLYAAYSPFYQGTFTGSRGALSPSASFNNLQASYSTPSRYARPNASEPLFLVPYDKNDQFVSRKDIMQCLWEQLHVDAQNHKRVAIVGLGGAGKTEIAIACVHQYHSDHPDHFVFWIHASNADRMRQDLLSAADSLRLRGGNHPAADKLDLLRTWLADPKNGSWLIVLDNADDLRTFTDSEGSPRSGGSSGDTFLNRYLPHAPHGSILATSRSKQVGQHLVRRPSQLIEVGQMSKHEALNLLRERDLQGTDEDLLKLACHLEYLPLAIIQAAAYIISRSMPVKRYISLLRADDNQLVRLLDRAPKVQFSGSRSIVSVASTWKLSFDQVRDQDPQAADLLAVMTFFDRQRIPIEWLRGSVNEQTPRDAIGFEDGLGLLKAYSLVSERSDTSTIVEMHRLLQIIMRSWLSERGEAQSRALEASSRISHHFPSGDYTTRDECKDNLPHAQKILGDPLVSEASLDRTSKLQRAWLRAKVARYLYSQNRFSEADIQSSLALAGLTSAGHKLDGDALQVQLEHVSILRALGKFDAAVKLAQEARKESKKTFGEDDDLTLAATERLVQALENRGDYSEATKLAKAYTETRRKKLGNRHPDVIGSLYKVASLLKIQGKYHDAEQYARQIIQSRSIDLVLGPEHPKTLKACYRLASTLSGQGRYREADEEFRKAIRSQKKAIGDEHYDTIISIFWFARNLHLMRQLREAESLLRKLSEQGQNFLGTNHPETWLVIGSLTAVLQDLSQKTNPPTTTYLTESKKLNEQLLQSRTEHLPPNHPDLIASMSALATDDRLLHNLDEAATREDEAWKLAKSSLGRDHPVSMQSAFNKALIYQAQGNMTAAAEWHELAFKRRKKVLTWRHPDTWLSARRLVPVLAALGKRARADKLRQRMAAHLEEGPEGLERLVGRWGRRTGRGKKR